VSENFISQSIFGPPAACADVAETIEPAASNIAGATKCHVRIVNLLLLGRKSLAHES
jgi:hypothetical protein